LTAEAFVKIAQFIVVLGVVEPLKISSAVSQSASSLVVDSVHWEPSVFWSLSSGASSENVVRLCEEEQQRNHSNKTPYMLLVRNHSNKRP